MSACCSMPTRNNNPQRVYILLVFYCDLGCVRFLFSGSRLVRVTDYVACVRATHIATHVQRALSLLNSKSVCALKTMFWKSKGENKTQNSVPFCSRP